jgi:hypothetical protein
MMRDHKKTVRAYLCFSLITLGGMLLLFLMCAGAIRCNEKDIKERISQTHDYESAIDAMMFVAFDRHDNGMVDWSSCAMSVRQEFYVWDRQDPKGIQLPDGNTWVLTNDYTVIRQLPDDRLRIKPENAEHYWAELLIFTEVVPYGTCRWQCDPEENPERCLTELLE